MEDDLSLPEVPRSLLTHLTQVYPDRLPQSAEVAPGLLGELVGQQQVIRYLQRLHEEHLERQLQGS